jgi:hypothetical protein
MKPNQAIRRTALLAAGLLLAAATATAAENVERRGDAPYDALVIIENIMGSVEVVGWDREEVELKGTLGDQVESLEFQPGATTRIEVKYPRHTDNIEEGADLVVRVPEACRLEIEVVAARVSVEGVRRSVSIASVSGGVTIAGPVDDLEVEAVSGDLVVDGVGRRTRLGNVSGDIRVRGGETELEIETVTSRIDVVCDELRKGELSTVSGRIELTTALAAKASLDIEAVNGDVKLRLPADVDAEFEVTTFNGDIESEFGGTVERTSRYAPGRELEFTNGGGSAEVRINTLNGKVDLLKK